MATIQTKFDIGDEVFFPSNNPEQIGWGEGRVVGISLTLVKSAYGKTLSHPEFYIEERYSVAAGKSILNFEAGVLFQDEKTLIEDLYKQIDKKLHEGDSRIID